MMIPMIKTLLTFQRKSPQNYDITENVVVDFIDVNELCDSEVEGLVYDACPDGFEMDWSEYYAVFYTSGSYVKFGNENELLFTAKITPVLEFNGNVFELTPIKI